MSTNIESAGQQTGFKDTGEATGRLEISITPAGLQEVANDVGIDDWRILYGKLVGPFVAESKMEEYRKCIGMCKSDVMELSEAEVVACIEGCADIIASDNDSGGTTGDGREDETGGETGGVPGGETEVPGVSH
jgi:hypothetical protein